MVGLGIELTCIDALSELSKECAGCAACQSICVKNCITMEETKEGFPVAVVDKSVCIDCGACERVCPQINPVFDNNPDPDCYAVKAPSGILEKSSSGGALSLISDAVFRDSPGYICGVVYDDEFNAVYDMVESKEGVAPFHGSKYVFSDMNGIYSRIKEKLSEGSRVLFVGCSCQVAAVKNMFKDSENLITVDLLCGGFASKKVFKKYIASLEETYGKEVADVRFRSAGVPYGSLKVVFKDGSSEVIHSDLYMRAFVKGLIKNKSCAQCQFGLPRQGDLTVGDLWNADKIISDTDLKNGISSVIVNNDRGKEIFESVQASAEYVSSVPLSFLKRFNKTSSSKTKPHLGRSRIFDMLDRGVHIQKALDYCLGWKYDVGITGFWRVHNFGGELTYYALYNLMLDLGQEPIFIEARHDFKGAPPDPKLLKGAYPFYAKARWYPNIEEQNELNLRVTNFVVGSDQVWNRRFVSQPSLECYALDFVADWRNKVAIAASFGTDRFEGNEEETARFAKLIRRFNHISVRESQAQEIIESFGKESYVILDPVMLCDPKHFDELISTNDHAFPEKYVFNYVMHPEIFVGMEKFYSRLGYGPVTVLNYILDTKNYDLLTINMHSVSDWVKCIRNSSFVLTDSFHATVFSILFRKPFVVLHGNLDKTGGLTRLETLLRNFGLEDRLFRTVDDALASDVMEKEIDYEPIHKALGKLKEKDIKWVKMALNIE